MAFENRSGLQLGPLETIVNVQWPSGVFVLEFEYSKTGLHPLIRLLGLPFASDINLFAAVIKYTITGGASTVITNPISKEMKKFVRVWNKSPPYQPVGSDDNIFVGRMMLLMQCSKVRSTYPVPTPPAKRDIVFTVRTPLAGGSFALPGAFAYWVWFDFGDPFPGIEPNTYQSNIAFDSVWGTQAEADARAAILNESSAYHVEAANGPTTNVPDLFSWRIRGSTYKSKKVDYPIKTAPPDQLKPDWDFGTDPNSIDLFGDEAANSIAGPGLATDLPAYNLTFRIKPNLSIQYARTT